MNAVEQRMQSFSISSSQQLNALFSTTQDVDGSSDLASQFAALLQTGEATFVSDKGAFRLVEAADAATYVVDGVETKQQLPDFLAGLNPADITLNSEKAAALTAGIPGLQLVQLTGLELSNLINSGQIQPLDTVSAGNAIAPSENNLFLFAAGGAPDGDNVHLLPLAQLESVSAGTFSKEATTPAVASNNPNASATFGSIAEQITSISDLQTANVTSQKAAGDVLAATDNTVATKEATLAASNITGLEKIESATQKSQQMTQTTGQSTEADASGAADGQMLQANEASKKSKAASNASAHGQALASQNSAMNQAAQQTAAATQPMTSKPALNKDHVRDDAPGLAATPTAYSNPATQMAPARAAAHAAAQPVITWTPEQISGGEGSAAEAIAGGLGALKGESSFMGSMGLIGGKPTATHGGHVAKQLNLNMSRAVRNGDNEFTMRMDPAELGHVKVKLSFHEDGKVTARVFAERPETLELLQRESRGLERAMEAGGHKATEGGIQFSLDSGDGESAGKAFAEAAQQENANDRKSAGSKLLDDDLMDDFEEMDEATLNEVLARVTPETGLDVRV